MNIVVCIKQVPDIEKVKIDRKSGNLIRESASSVLDPNCEEALEAAMRIKDSRPGTCITVISMGPVQAEDALRECLAFGADEAVLLNDYAFAGADTWATSNVLAYAIRRLNADLIICGIQTVDGATAQVGPELAEKLDIPNVAYVNGIELREDGLIVQRCTDDSNEIVDVTLPCLLSITKNSFIPRYKTVSRIFAACEKNITVWNSADINISGDAAGAKASPTIVRRSFVPPPKGKCVFLDSAAQGTVRQLAGIIQRRGHLKQEV